MNKYTQTSTNKQTGAALVVSLMMLLVMTILGITAMQTNILQEKMAGGSRDVSLSFQSAEAAMREAEIYVETIVSPSAAFDGSTAWLYPNGSDPDVSNSASTWGTARAYTTTTIANVNTPPKYIIELIGAIGSGTTDVNVTNYGESSGAGTVNSFRVTAKGTGGSDNTVTILQSYYAKRI